jgi:hypothetical protein
MIAMTTSSSIRVNPIVLENERSLCTLLGNHLAFLVSRTDFGFHLILPASDKVVAQTFS